MPSRELTRLGLRSFLFFKVIHFMKRLMLAASAALCLYLGACVGPALAYTNVTSSAAEAGHVLKASPGSLTMLYVTAGASAGMLLVFNSTTVLASGAVTPSDCIGVPANTTVQLPMLYQNGYTVGISVAFTIGGCFMNTPSATAFFHAVVN